MNANVKTTSKTHTHARAHTRKKKKQLNLISSPIQALQVVCSHDVDILLPALGGKEHNLLRVAALEERAHGLNLVAGLHVLLGGQLVGALLCVYEYDKRKGRRKMV